MVWEYKTIVIEVRTNAFDAAGEVGFKPIETDMVLNAMGKESWEMIESFPITKAGHTIQVVNIFKKPILNKASNLPDIGYDIDKNGITGSQL